MNEHLSLIIYKCQKKMTCSLDVFKKHLQIIRIGLASLDMFKDIKITYNEKITKINQIASINIKYPNIIYIQPWDKKNLNLIEKSINDSFSHINCQNDGQKLIIKLPLPTQEQRLLLIKNLNKECENNKIQIRNIRRIHNNLVKKYIKNNHLSSDLEKKYINLVQIETERTIQTIDVLTEKKTHNILKV